MSNVFTIDVPQRPKEVALSNAIRDVIYEIACDEMTLAEIVGCLEVVKIELIEDVKNQD